MSAKPPPVSAELSRELSLFHITMMGLGMMIGAGVFLGTGKSIGYAGPGGVLLTFALNGLIAIFTAMSYAELSSAIPRAGGAYNFARIAFGRGPSFVAGWMEWFASSVAGALYAVCFATYVVRFFEGLGWINLEGPHAALSVKLVAAAIATLFIYVNYRGASETGKVGAFMTLFQTLFLLGIGIAGLFVVWHDPSRLENFSPFLSSEHGSWRALLVTMGFTAVAFEGYEVIAQAGDETIDPRRNIPKAMLYSVLIVTFTYVICAIATVVAVKASPDLVIDGQVVAPWQWIGAHGGEGFGAAVELLIPKWGGFLVVLAVIFASTSALNATVYSATRASYALGRDRMLPAFFSRISVKRNTPWVALCFTGVIVLLVATCLDADQVASSASIMFLFLFFMVNLCVIRVRYHMGDELNYGFLMPFFPVLPILAIICQGVLAVFLHEMGRLAWIIAPSWVGAGILIYFFYSKSRALATEDEIQVIEEEKVEVEGLPAIARVAKEGYRVMVAVANPENALSMVKATYRLSRAKQAQIELLHMVPVPDQVPLTDAEKYMHEGREAITEIMLYLAPLFPISSTFRYCRSVSRGIISAVREKKTELLILGWRASGSKSRRFLMDSTLDPILDRVPCNTLILKNCGDRDFKNILVPVSGGPNSAYALEIASILADPEEGQISVFTAETHSGEEVFDIDAFIDAQLPKLSFPRERIRSRRLSVHHHVVRTIVNEAEREEDPYDLVVVGCTRASRVRRLARHSVPETVARVCKLPVVMVNASGGIQSWLKRWV